MTIAHLYFEQMAIFFVQTADSSERSKSSRRRAGCVSGNPMPPARSWRQVQLRRQGYRKSGAVVSLTTWWHQRVTVWPFRKADDWSTTPAEAKKWLPSTPNSLLSHRSWKVAREKKIQLGQFRQGVHPRSLSRYFCLAALFLWEGSRNNIQEHPPGAIWYSV